MANVNQNTDNSLSPYEYWQLKNFGNYIPEHISSDSEDAFNNEQRRFSDWLAFNAELQLKSEEVL
jgi:hypothetical protein